MPSSKKYKLCDDYKFINGKWVLHGRIKTQYGTFIFDNDRYIRREPNT